MVGGGPAGLHAAWRLAEAGLNVVLIEARERIGEGAICSGVIGEEAFARFDLPSSAVLTVIRSIQAISPGGQKLEHSTGAPLARVVDKGAFNRALAERVMEAGVAIELNRQVERVECGKHSVGLSLRSPWGECGNLRARVGVIASGVNSSLNRTLGLARPRQYLRAIQAEVPVSAETALASTQVYVGRSTAPGAFGWLIPLGPGRVRAGMMTTSNPRPYFEALLNRALPNSDTVGIEPAQKAIAQAAVGRCVADRLLVVGEAAGHVKTSTGGGIYYGLLSAEFAVEAVLRAFRKGDFAAQALGDFERYWRTAFGNELLVGYFARELASRLPDRVIERIFEETRSRNLLARLNGRLKFDWHQKALLATLRNLLICPAGIGHV